MREFYRSLFSLRIIEAKCDGTCDCEIEESPKSQAVSQAVTRYSRILPDKRATCKIHATEKLPVHVRVHTVHRGDLKTGYYCTVLRP